MIILSRKNSIEKHQVWVEKGTKIGKNFNIEHYIGVLKLAKHRAGVKFSSLQTKLIADFSFNDFKGAVPLLIHEKNFEPNLDIFVHFLIVALELQGSPMGCQIEDEQSQEGERVGRIRNKYHLTVLRGLFLL